MTPPAAFGGDVLLADTSVWRKADQLPDAKKDEWLRAVENNQIASVPVVLFELLYRSRENTDYFRRWYNAFAGLSRYLLPDRHVWDIARAAYVELFVAKQLTNKSLTDIIVAATASRHAIPVIHLDKDYDRLAALDCMDVEPRRIVPAGTDLG